MADILSDVCAEHAHGCRPADCSKPLCNGWQKEFANLRARRTLPRLARGKTICDGFQAPSQTCSLPYRLWSQRSAPVLALRNSVATDAAQADDISPFFAALAAIPTACFSALMPLRISFLAFCLPLVPAAS